MVCETCAGRPASPDDPGRIGLGRVLGLGDRCAICGSPLQVPVDHFLDKLAQLGRFGLAGQPLLTARPRVPQSEAASA